MRDYAFYNIDNDQTRLRLAVVPTRRLLRRLLRPMFLRQEQILRDLGEAVDHLSRCCADLERRQEELAQRYEDVAERHEDLAQRHEDLTERWGKTNHLAVHLFDVWAENNHDLVMDHKKLRKEMSQAIRQLEQDTSAVAAIGWDHVAVARRIAAIEDHLGDS
jgi:septal ring factor EnvC (AmiA/AmiB activator)